MGISSHAPQAPRAGLARQCLLAFLLVGLVVILAVALPSSPNPRPDKAVAANRGIAQPRRLLWRQPPLFEPNVGQAPAAIRYIAREAVARWLFTRRTATLLLPRRAPAVPGVASLQFTPLGASNHILLTAFHQTRATVNYDLGRNPQSWRHGIPTFDAIRYHAVYPGVDLIFRGRGTGMEFEWVLAPGTDPRHIALAFQGATSSHLEPNGSLVLATAGGDVRQSPPLLYQTVDHRRRYIAGHYILGSDNVVRLWVGRYDHARPLIVDPTIRYAAILSGSLDDSVNGIAVDRAGNAYVTGATRSDDFPAVSPLQATFGGESDAFVIKLDPAGKIIYSTYLGGERDDEGFALKVDAAGDVIVVGATSSKNFPITPGAFQVQPGGGTCPQGGASYPCEDAFIAKLDPTGRTLLYSTYLGGNADDWASGIDLDPQGDAVVVGSTDSPNFPTVHALRGTLRSRTCGRYATVYRCPDAFVAKLNPSGAGLVFSTYLGGTDNDEATAVALGPDGSISLTGITYSADFPSVRGMRRVQRTPCKENLAPAGRCPRAFVTTMTGNGSRLLFSTYLGGSNRDWGNGIAVDHAGNLYVAGQTTSTDFPVAHRVQPAHYKGTCHGTSSAEKYPCPDAFITKLNPHTGRIVYSSHIGGTALDGASAVAVDARGDAYVAGYAGSYNFPTLHAVQKRTGGGEDSVVFELTPQGNRAYFSTYLGGEHDDEAYAIALGGSGDAYVAGSTDSPKFPRSVKYGTVPRGLDGFVVRIHAGKLKPAALPCALLYGERKTGCVK